MADGEPDAGYHDQAGSDCDAHSIEMAIFVGEDAADVPTKCRATSTFQQAVAFGFD